MGGALRILGIGASHCHGRHSFFPSTLLTVALDGVCGVLANNNGDTQFVSPMPIFPATEQDFGFPYGGTNPNAQVCIGTRLMLPSTFNVGSLTTAAGKSSRAHTNKVWCHSHGYRQ